MPTPVKTLDAMTKHMTAAERQARQDAEGEILPDRPCVNLKMPTCVRSDKAAAKYWRGILKRMDGLWLLDDLDSEALGIYCSMLSRRDALDGLCRQILAEVDAGELDTDRRLEALAKVDGLMTKLQNHEKTILQYADRLGLTPSGRTRLARKRAEQAAAQADPDGDLFGD